MGNKVDPELVAFFAQRLRHFRTQRGFTQEELAEEAGMHPESISRLENGRAQPSITVLVSLTRALGCRTDDLLGHQVPGEPEGLAPQDSAMLKRWRLLTPESRSALLALLKTLG